MISLSTQAAPQGVVHSYTAYASDSNTLPPPTSSLLSLPPTPHLPSSALPVQCAGGYWERGRQPEKPDNQEAVTSGPR